MHQRTEKATENVLNSKDSISLTYQKSKKETNPR